MVRRSLTRICEGMQFVSFWSRRSAKSAQKESALNQTRNRLAQGAALWHDTPPKACRALPRWRKLPLYRRWRAMLEYFLNANALAPWNEKACVDAVGGGCLVAGELHKETRCSPWGCEKKHVGRKKRGQIAVKSKISIMEALIKTQHLCCRVAHLLLFLIADLAVARFFLTGDSKFP